MTATEAPFAPPPGPVLPAQKTWPLFLGASVRRHEAAALRASPPQALMQRAGLACARLAGALAPHARTVWIAAGPGNNGGDGVEAALRLAARGRQVVLTAAGIRPDRLPDDARAAWARAAQAGLAVAAAPPSRLGPQDLIIDALLGLGAARPLEGELAQAAQWMMELQASSGCPLLAVDLPSGLDADRGCWPQSGPRLRADYTLSLLALKPGLFTADGRDACGQVWHDDLGAPPEPSEAEAWLVGADVVASLPPRQHVQHKGSFGSVWVIGGARGMQGAAHLASAAALRVGAGRVHLCATDPTEAFPVNWPELMPRRPTQALDAARAAWQARTDLRNPDVWVAGCGGGTDIATLLPPLLEAAPRLVLDADALNALAADTDLQEAVRARAARGQATVITPHPLEAARLLRTTAEAVQSNRLPHARLLARQLQALVVLKGSGTVTVGPEGPIAINGSGNAALATAGSGDVLAGLLGGLWAQGLDAATAARLAVWRHGHAAEAAGRRSLRASDLLEA